MHIDTRNTLITTLRNELQNDPSERGYVGKTISETVDLLNSEVINPGAVIYQDVLISDVEGYLAARLLLVGLQDWMVTAPPGPARQAARQLLQIIEGGRLRVFLTSDPIRRNSVLTMFQGLCASGAGELTMDHYSDLVAMTQRTAPAVLGPSRWMHVIDGISGIGSEPGPPNAATEELVEEALNG